MIQRYGLVRPAVCSGCWKAPWVAGDRSLRVAYQESDEPVVATYLLWTGAGLVRLLEERPDLVEWSRALPFFARWPVLIAA